MSPWPRVLLGLICHRGHVYCYLPEQDDLVKEELSVHVMICKTIQGGSFLSDTAGTPTLDLSSSQ